jgi:hypothetical protein
MVLSFPILLRTVQYGTVPSSISQAGNDGCTVISLLRLEYGGRITLSLAKNKADLNPSKHTHNDLTYIFQ